MLPTDIKNPEYFHKIVDCQYACPAHTPVPEYIRLIARRQYTEAYVIIGNPMCFPVCWAEHAIGPVSQPVGVVVWKVRSRLLSAG